MSKVDFYANGAFIGTGSPIGLDRFTVDWVQVPDGIYALTAVATDNLGVSVQSAGITIAVNTQTPAPGEFVWFDDDVPAGATKHIDGDGDWYWVDANPGAFSGKVSHQSKNFGPFDYSRNNFHQHWFDGATAKLPINAGDKLSAYLFLDINSMPLEIMLQWNDGNGWEHRAYWGDNLINFGADGTNSRRYMGPLPRAGQWVRLEVPASLVGLEGTMVSGMAFALEGGRATWDLAGKTTANAPPPPTTPPGDFVWIEDALPAGAIPGAEDDEWNWLCCPRYSGQYSHQTRFQVKEGKQYRSHYFTGAQTPMMVNPGDVLFTYVHVGDQSNPDNAKYKPEQIILQWYDGSNWEHRAYWGENFVGRIFPSRGVQGTESQRYMGGVPPVTQCSSDADQGCWYRLEVPASYVGLEGKAVSGMAFGAYRDAGNPLIFWDRSGVSSQPTSVPLPLSATTGIWRLYGTNANNGYNGDNGYSYATNDIGNADQTQQGIHFYAHPNQAAGTVPFYRWRSSSGNYFYTTCSTCSPPNDWRTDGVAFYVYPDSSTPGTVPLYRFHNNVNYFYSVDPSAEGLPGMVYDGVDSSHAIAAYVYPNNALVPVRPFPLNLLGGTCGGLYWLDNSSNETGFKIERRFDPDPTWTQIATVGANVTYYNASCSPDGSGSSQPVTSPSPPLRANNT